MYARKGGQYVRDASGKPVVEKWRVYRYGYKVVGGKKVRTKPVNVLVEKHPDRMSSAELRALDRKLEELLLHSETFIEAIQAATEELRCLNDGEGATGSALNRASKKVVGLIEKHKPKGAASFAALDEFLVEAKRCVAKGEAQADKADREIVEEEAAIEEMQRNVRKAREVVEARRRSRSLAVVCIHHNLDPDIRAGDATRRVYESYLRNHVLVPTEQDRGALGDLAIYEIDKKVLKAYEQSFYVARSGFHYAHDVRSEETAKAIQTYILDGVVLPSTQVDQKAISPKTVAKILTYLAGVVQWALQEPSRWGLEEYHHNLVANYQMARSEPTRRKAFAPRTAAFWDLIAAAEELGLQHMVPLMALTRCSFRPSESRGIRWVDLGRADLYGEEWDVATLKGTVRYLKGGEAWVSEGKTEAALNDPVVIPASIMELLRAHKVEGCEYVCPPAPVDPTKKNADRKVKPFLTRDAYAEGWRQIRERVGLPEGTDMYTLKHGMIAELLKRGFTPEQICLMTRHTTVEMINRIYGALQSGDLAQAIDDLHADRSPRKPRAM